MADLLLREDAAGVATLALNRPTARNALSLALLDALEEMLAALAVDRAVKAVVITGAGPGFCAGHDLRELTQARNDPDRGQAFFETTMARCAAVMQAVARFPKPTIAAVNGAAAGLGCDMALCCDFIMAAESAHFTMSFIARGLIPDGGGMYFLPRRVGLARAKELVFSGRRVGAAEALAMQMIERVVPDAELMAAAEAWARELSAGSLAALALAKSVMDRSLEMSFEDVLAEGSKAQAMCYTTGEHRASVAEFLAKSGR